MSDDFDKVLADVVADLELPYALKAEQIDALKALVGGADTFCLLPTGFGKSDIFALATLMLQRVQYDFESMTSITMADLAARPLSYIIILKK